MGALVWGAAGGGGKGGAGWTMWAGIGLGLFRPGAAGALPAAGIEYINKIKITGLEMDTGGPKKWPVKNLSVFVF